MKKLIFFPAFFYTLIIIQAQTLSVMSYNIRYDNPADGENAWENRKEAVVDLIDRYNPDVIGVQEGMIHQIEFIDTSLARYTYVGLGRSDGWQGGELNPVFYDSSQFKLVWHKTIWLSETPHMVSKGWDAMLERICTLALLQNKVTGDSLLIANTHFDHVGEIARLQSANLLSSWLSEIKDSNVPVVLMGDFNATPETEVVKTLRSQLPTFSLSDHKAIQGPKHTFTGFTFKKKIFSTIDYVFASENLNTISVVHIDDMRDGRLFISDHLPVLVLFEPAN
jgi:endonuclease/exonuclease/phosphatase family metal-dependent hydrolase